MEQVILVDDQNNEIGIADKETIHTTNTPLHRAFSLFVFNSHNQLLVTKRAHSKKTFSGVWTNTVCGHPGPNESVIDAAIRRLRGELGIVLDNHVTQAVTEVGPYRYRFTDEHGIVENEICPILVAYFDGNPKPDPQEVVGWKWISWQDFLKEIRNDKNDKTSVYSPWCKEEAFIIANSNFFNR